MSYFRAEDWRQKELLLQGVPVRLRTYRIDESYVAEIESTSIGENIAQAISRSNKETERMAVETAIQRLRPRSIDPNLMVGG